MTIKDILEKLEGMKKKPFNHPEKCDEECKNKPHFIYNQALEEAKPIIEKEIRELLEGLKGEEKQDGWCPSCGSESYGWNEREQKLREEIERITKE